MTLQAIRIVDPRSVSAACDGADNSYPIARRIRVLLLKPYQPIAVPTHSPPLGLLYITAGIREKLGDNVDIKIIDMKLHQNLNLSSWYENVYGYPLDKWIRKANLKFYLSPRRVYLLLRHLDPRSFWMNFKSFVRMLLKK